MNAAASRRKTSGRRTSADRRPDGCVRNPMTGKLRLKFPSRDGRRFCSLLRPVLRQSGLSAIGRYIKIHATGQLQSRRPTMSAPVRRADVAVHDFFMASEGNRQGGRPIHLRFPGLMQRLQLTVGARYRHEGLARMRLQEQQPGKISATTGGSESTPRKPAEGGCSQGLTSENEFRS
jgi:hypothetical protein